MRVAGLWVTREFTFPRRFERFGRLIDKVLKRFGYKAIKLEGYEWAWVYHRPPVKLVVVKAERVYASGYDSNWGSWESSTGESRATLTFFVPETSDLKGICQTIKEEIDSFRQAQRARDRERRRRKK